jgi:hypothetical protein
MSRREDALMAFATVNPSDRWQAGPSAPAGAPAPDGSANRAEPAGAIPRLSSVEAPAPEAAEKAPDAGDGSRSNADGDRLTLSREAARREPAAGGEELSEDERRQVEKLERRDTRVKAHEQAHVAAAGDLYRGGPTYEYQTGPDGKRYAVGGSVRIDTSEGRSSEETVRKAQRIRRAALAPQDPSSTDRAVAAKAQRMEAEARRELVDERLESSREVVDERPVSSPPSPEEATEREADDERAAAPDPPRVSTRAPFDVANLSDVTLQTKPTEALRSKPTEALQSKPTEALRSKPTEALESSPTEALRSDRRDARLAP